MKMKQYSYLAHFSSKSENTNSLEILFTGILSSTRVRRTIGVRQSTSLNFSEAFPIIIAAISGIDILN